MGECTLDIMDSGSESAASARASADWAAMFLEASGLQNLSLDLPAPGRNHRDHHQEEEKNLLENFE